MVYNYQITCYTNYPYLYWLSLVNLCLTFDFEKVLNYVLYFMYGKN
jgi:hypothetical protein